MVENGNGHGHIVDAYGRDFSAMRSASLHASSDESGMRAAADNIVLDRLVLARMLGMTHQGKRNTYQIFGYDDNITAQQYRERYARGGIAARVVNAKPKAVWRGDGTIYEDEDPEVTAFEKEWKELNTRHAAWSTCKRAHILASLSSFSVLLIGAQGNLDTELPRGRPGQILYLQPFGGGVVAPNAQRGAVEGAGADVVVQEWDEDTRSPRFGFPTKYQVRRTSTSSRNELRSVHWTRVIHIPASGFLDDAVYGPPALEAVWNYLLDLDKVVGGGSEAFWLRATKITQFDIDKKMALEEAKDSLPALKEQVEKIEHNLSRYIRTRGVNINEVGSDVADFKNQAMALVTLIAGTSEIPMRILVGSERGELASGQDADNWDDQVKDERKDYAYPVILRPLVERLIQYGYLSQPKQWEPQWPDTAEMTEEERLDSATKAAALNDHGETVITSAEIRERYLDLEPLEENELEAEDPEEEQVAQLEAALRRGGMVSIAVSPRATP